MAYFLYTPEDRAQNQPDNLQLVAADEAEEQLTRMRLLNHMIEEHGDISPLDIDTFVNSDNANLPIAITSRLLSRLGLVVVDAVSGLGMSSTYDSEGPDSFEVAFFEVTSLESELPDIPSLTPEGEIVFPPYSASEVTDDPTFNYLVAEHCFNYFGFQVEFGEGKPKGVAVEHFSLGNLNDMGEYEPVVTLINPVSSK